ncbi:uncharacterized protein LOC120519495 [Polypterus senegalus]|uniref:uncharacterized protein LOC120519495 n=1 Tax=Polypterus senegalus TaxID=55291 RepID=UPI0019656B8D|nr:uncharacterized protein LOC120519495 [Polypterus senegalus]
MLLMVWNETSPVKMLPLSFLMSLTSLTICFAVNSTEVSEAHLKCSHNGKHILWYKQNDNQRPRLIGKSTTNILAVSSLERELSSNYYYCVVRQNGEYVFTAANFSAQMLSSWSEVSRLWTTTLPQSNNVIEMNIGENLTLECEMNNGDVLWYKQQREEPPLVIVTVFFKTTLPVPLYHNGFKITPHKSFRLQDTSYLSLRSLSDQDNAMYYCVRDKDGELHFEKGTELRVKVEEEPNTTDFLLQFYWICFALIIGMALSALAFLLFIARSMKRERHSLHIRY